MLRQLPPSARPSCHSGNQRKCRAPCSTNHGTNLIIILQFRSCMINPNANWRHWRPVLIPKSHSSYLLLFNYNFIRGVQNVSKSQTYSHFPSHLFKFPRLCKQTPRSFSRRHVHRRSSFLSQWSSSADNVHGDAVRVVELQNDQVRPVGPSKPKFYCHHIILAFSLATREALQQTSQTEGNCGRGWN